MPRLEILAGVPFDSGGSTFVAPGLNEMVIYEAAPRLFAKSNSLNAIRARLGKISSLGVNVIWLMPIFSASEVRSPKGSPYSMKDFMAIDPEYGTVDDLKDLVKEAHNRGMAVILDFVTNHTGADCSWVTEHKDWYMSEYTPTYTDAALFDWSNTTLQNQMIETMRYWINVADIDGYRCDTASPTREGGVTLGFWNKACANLRNAFKKKNLILLAESAKADVLSNGFQLNYGWHYCEYLMDIFRGTKQTSEIFTINASENDIPAGTARMRFSTNHDRSAQENEYPGLVYGGSDAQIAAFAIAATMGGVPLIYSSQEIAYMQRIPIFKSNAPLLDWNSGTDMTAEYRELTDISKLPVMRKGSIAKISNQDVVSFVRTYGNEQMLVVVNVRDRNVSFSVPETYKAKFDIPSYTLDAYDYLILPCRK